MTVAQVVETSVTVNNNSPFQDYLHPDDHAQPTYYIFTFYYLLLLFIIIIYYYYLLLLFIIILQNTAVQETLKRLTSQLQAKVSLANKIHV